MSGSSWSYWSESSRLKLFLDLKRTNQNVDREVIIPSSKEMSNHFHLRRNLSLSTEKNATSKIRLPLRTRSEPHFNTWQKIVGERDVLKSSSVGLPKLFPRGTQRITGVIKLNTTSERKYRSLRDQTKEFTEEGNFFSRKRTYHKDLNSRHVILPQLRRDKNPMKCSFEEKSFCDTLSTFPCSSITRNSICSLDILDDREVCFIPKHKTVSNWIDSVEMNGKMPLYTCAW